MFTLSARTYLFVSVLVSMILLTATGAYFIYSYSQIEKAARLSHHATSQQEIYRGIELVMQRADEIMGFLENWDEVHQQLGNPGYYPYWRDHRLPAVRNIPGYIPSIELYSIDGAILDDKSKGPLPRKYPNMQSQITRAADGIHLFIYRPVRVYVGSREINGYIGMQINFLDALRHLNRFAHINPQTITVPASITLPNDPFELAGLLTYQELHSSESTQFQDLLYTSVTMFSALGVIIILVYFWMISAIFSKPLQKLYHQAAALRHDRTPHSLNVTPARFNVMEISALTHALSDYHSRLQEFNLSLEEKVKQRTAELERANAEVARASKAKTEFLSRMSHELRTPLNAILGFSQLLENDQTLTPDQRDQVKEILGAGTHLLELINEVLDLSRIESGTIRLKLQPVNVMQTIEESLKMVMPQMRKKGIVVNIEDIEECRCMVIAEPLRLKEVFLNLFSNAVKYNGDNGRIKILCESQADEQLRICIIDNGPGLTKEQVNMLFEPFSRLGAEYSGIEGTGIGLTICRRLVGYMHGEIGVESEPGSGSRFYVQFQLATDN
jgi:signal transduction histidine kinase